MPRSGKCGEFAPVSITHLLILSGDDAASHNLAMKAPPKPTKPKPRAGRAVWIAETDHELLLALAKAEERSQPTVLSRALRLYASDSPEYQAILGNRSKGAR